ncbi:MAG: porin [Parvularculales bacterium]
MKKMLLGSTALATAGLAVAPAVASELSIRISGYMNSGFYITDADDREIRASYDLRTNTEMASLNTLNRLHPLNQDKAAPGTFIFAATCDTGTLTIRDEMAVCFTAGDSAANPPTMDTLHPGPTPDLMTPATDNATVYFTQKEGTATSTDEYSQTQVKLGSGHIVIDADGRLENGMYIGGRVRLEAFGEETAGEIIDEHYFYMSGEFGRIVLGAKDGAAYQMHYSSPWFVPGNGVDSPNFYNIGRTSVRTNTYAQMSDDAVKITYFTPLMGGFQLGTSYTPNNRDKNGLGNGFGLTTDGTDMKGVENIVDFGANYTRDIKFWGYQSLRLGLSAGWEAGSTNVTGAEDPINWSIGGSLRWRTFVFGGAYYYGENLDNTQQTSERETTAWTAGVSWTHGPWRVGAAYLQATEEGGMKTDGDALGNEENSFLQIGGGYGPGRGVSVGVDVQFIGDDNGGTMNETRVLKSTSAGVVMNISF